MNDILWEPDKRARRLASTMATFETVPERQTRSGRFDDYKRHWDLEAWTDLDGFCVRDLGIISGRKSKRALYTTVYGEAFRCPVPNGCPGRC